MVDFSALMICSSMNFFDYMHKDQYHPIWGHIENYTAGREKQKQLLLMLCQHEADRLEVWAQPVNSKENTSEKWIEYARIAFSVDPQIALSLASRFPTNTFLKAKMTQLVQRKGMMGSGKTTVENATGLVAPIIATGLGALTHTLGTLVPVIRASGFATAAATTAIGTVVGSFR
ncbi:unnamed protein product [Camellia sinensis]